MNTKQINALFVPTYSRNGSPIISGKGSYLFDANNRAFLDFGSGIAVNALGYGHPALEKALINQGTTLLHASNLYFTQPQIDLAQLLIKKSFGKKVFFCNSGTEANEAAIKFARKWARSQSDDKFSILSFRDGFHGRTYGALSATAQENFHSGFDPMIEGFHYAPFNNITATRKLLKQHKFAAIIVEPLQGEGGINSATPEFLAFLRQEADKRKIALIFDEIQCGLGRTGTLWNYQQYRIVPDIMTLAKPLGGGLPLGAVVCTGEIADAINPGDHGTTFGGNPVACALGVAVLSNVADKTFLKKVKEKGRYLQERLRIIMAGNASFESIRGKGLLIGIRMKKDPTEIIRACANEGLLLIKAGHHTIRFIPPLTVRKSEINKALSIFRKVIKQYS